MDEKKTIPDISRSPRFDDARQRLPIHHGEAFCLMTYSCEACWHREVLWNSRDGVTPFGLACVSCKSLKTYHVGRDKFAPLHIPPPGQRIFVDMTEEAARFYARKQSSDPVWLADFLRRGGTQEDLEEIRYRDMSSNLGSAPLVRIVKSAESAFEGREATVGYAGLRGLKIEFEELA